MILFNCISNNVILYINNNSFYIHLFDKFDALSAPFFQLHISLAKCSKSHILKKNNKKNILDLYGFILISKKSSKKLAKNEKST